MRRVREQGTFHRKASTCERHDRRQSTGRPACCPWALKEPAGDTLNRGNPWTQTLPLSHSNTSKQAHLHGYASKQN